MIRVYDTRGSSFVLLRPRNKVKLTTPSAEKWICMGKWARENLAFFLEEKKARDDQNF